MGQKQLLEKYEQLKRYIVSLKRVAVAFSAGVDSAFLLYSAKQALGDQVVAITVKVASFPERELVAAKDLCKGLGVQHRVVTVDEFTIDGFASNPKNRCYICKRRLFETMLDTAKNEGITSVLEGTNLDDEGDYRPGLQALKELKIISPLRICGFTKHEIRELSRILDIPTWDKPSLACLSTRFPYGEEITKEKLSMVERAENYLKSLGFKQLRVRIHGMQARIELLPEDFTRMLDRELREKIYEVLRSYGFAYVSLDLLGYRTGSMNEMIN